MVPMLGAAVEVAGRDGEHVVIDPLMPMMMSAGCLALIILPVILIILFYFYKKKQQTRMILAAIEKGLPVSDYLIEPKEKSYTAWIKNLSTGIGLLFLGLAGLAAMIFMPYLGLETDSDFLIISIIMLGLGLIFLLRGILLKRYETASENKTQVCNELPNRSEGN